MTRSKSKDYQGSVAIITPVYKESPGTYYRIRLLAKSFIMRGYKVYLISLSNPYSDKNKKFLFKLYYTFGEKVLRSRISSTFLGLIEYNFIQSLIRQIDNLKAVIIITDILAPLAFILNLFKKKGLLTIISIEDLSASYLADLKNKPITKEEIERYINSLCTLLFNSDYITSSSIFLAKLISYKCGLNNTFATPIGVDMLFVDNKEFEKVITLRTS